MRRRIQLYIAGKLADLEEQGLLLYNYAFTDLQLPSVVKNSFSKQITLPATAQNLALLGHPENVQRATGSGVSGIGIDFNAGKKTPFELRDELNEVLESGYIRLDSTIVTGRRVTGLKITLFGGIGSFFYNLAYNRDGSKKTLGDLDYEVPLGSFTIEATAIASAWSRLFNHSQSEGISNKWDIINFAPAYNGIPSGDFDANKAIISPSLNNLPDQQIIEGENAYITKGGLALLNMAQAHDEWAVKDLRSYLQRPVLSMRAFMEAICEPAQNGGFDVDISQIPADMYIGVWKTLPMISSLGSFRTVTRTTALESVAIPEGNTDYLARLVYAQTVPGGASVEAYAYLQAGFVLSQELSNPAISAAYTGAQGAGYKYVIVFCQLCAVAGDTIIAASPATCFTAYTAMSIQNLAAQCGYAPKMSAGFSGIITPNVGHEQGGEYYFSSYTPQMTVNSEAVSYYVLDYKCYILTTVMNGSTESIVSVDAATIGLFNADSDAPVYYSAQSIRLHDISSTVNYTTSAKLRSGATVDIYQLLASAYSPAEYLLSFCKMHGLVFDYDPGAKKVTILPRNVWFNGDTMDLSGRIDRSKDITIEPLAMKSKWYELSGGIVEGAYAVEYKDKYGVQYAIQRVNTGYDFDAATENLMESVVFKGAVTRLDSSAYWNILKDRGTNKLIPSVFLDAGNTYTLWGGNGEGKEFQVPVPDNSASIQYYNDTYKGYDKQIAPKMEFRDKDGKALDGADVLCRFVGTASYSRFALSDDTIETLALNNGKPCWRMDRYATSRTIPIFHRYNAFTPSDLEIVRSLDYGIPREVDLPGFAFNTDTGSLYLRYWKKYLTDLLDKDTKVMRCRVDLGGLQVGPALLRKFYWYEGSLWVLNKITNYSLTTWDSVECEFVQVKDKNNYTETVENYYLRVPVTEHYIDQTARTIAIQVSANVEWSAAVTGAFLSVSPASGTGDGTIQVTVSANATSSQRTGTIRLTCTSGEDVPDVVISIIQEGVADYHMVPSATSLNIDAAGGTQQITISANVAWVLVEIYDWISCSPSSGTGNGQVTITIAENQSTTARNASINLHCNDQSAGIEDVTISVYQSGASAGDQLEIWNEDVPYQSTENVPYSGAWTSPEIIASGPWTAYVDVPWIEDAETGLQQWSGQAMYREQPFTLRVAPNSGATRVGHLIATLTGTGITATYTITQLGN